MGEKKKQWLKEHGKGDVFELTWGELEELCKALERSCPIVDYIKGGKNETEIKRV